MTFKKSKTLRIAMLLMSLAYTALCFINPTYFVSRLSQTCFQIHVGCRFTINTISMSFLASYIYVSVMSFLEVGKYKGYFMVICYLCKCFNSNTKNGEHVKVSVVLFQQSLLHLLLMLLLCDSMKHTYLTFH